MENTTHESIGWDFCDFLNYDSGNDFVLYEIGTCKCQPRYSFGPSVRRRDIFHYVRSGCGKLILNGKEFCITKGQGFLIPSDTMAYYEADSEDPWDYCWIHVGGYRIINIWKEIGLSTEHPVYIPDCEDNTYELIYDDLIRNHEREMYTIGKLCELLDHLIVHSSSSPQTGGGDQQLSHIRKIITYIQTYYSSHIQLADIAAVCGLDRSYMARLFKEATGLSIHTYLTNYRMNKAQELLRNPTNSIQYVSLSVGYSDVFSFSKAFKKKTGLSPRQWRTQQLLEHS